MVTVILSKEKVNTKKDYPYLGISENGDGKVIVLFTDINEGVVVYSSNVKLWHMGEYDNGWNEDGFDIYSGEIKLNNK